MTFKENIHRRFTPLTQLLCAPIDRAFAPFQKAATVKVDPEEMSGVYRATASLVQVAAGLFYATEGPFAHLFSSFLLPPWRASDSGPTRVVKRCLGENLPAVSSVLRPPCLTVALVT